MIKSNCSCRPMPKGLLLVRTITRRARPLTKKPANRQTKATEGVDVKNFDLIHLIEAQLAGL